MGKLSLSALAPEKHEARTPPLPPAALQLADVCYRAAAAVAYLSFRLAY